MDIERTKISPFGRNDNQNLTVKQSGKPESSSFE